MKTDNRGFTLTELIVSIAIFSIVLLTAFSFMTAGAKSYTNVEGRVTRQLKAQLALNQISSCLMNCNAGVNFSDDKSELYLLSRDGGSYTLQVFRRSADGTLQYGSAAAEAKRDGSAYTAAVTNWSRVASGVERFSLALSPENGELRKADITLQFSGAASSFSQTIALRNAPPRVTLIVS